MSAVEELPMVVPGLVGFNDDASQPMLMGSRCKACGAHAYPYTEICQSCCGETEKASLGSGGTIYSHTTVRVKPPFKLPRSYAVAYIDLHAVSLRIFGLLDLADGWDQRIGDSVRLVIRDMGVNVEGDPCRRPCFTLVETATE